MYLEIQGVALSKRDTRNALIAMSSSPSDHGPADTDQEPGANEPPALRTLDRGLASIELMLRYVVAVFLIGLAVISLANVVVLVWPPLTTQHDYTMAISIGFDTVFLTVILLEVLHTVLSRGPLVRQIQEFLVIGVTSAVRHGLEIAAAVGTTRQEVRTVCNNVTALLRHVQRVCQQVPVSAPTTSSGEIVKELVVNAGAVLLLVIALWLVRQGSPAGSQRGS
jgi:hypothetical protein